MYASVSFYYYLYYPSQLPIKYLTKPGSRIINNNNADDEVIYFLRVLKCRCDDSSPLPRSLYSRIDTGRVEGVPVFATFNRSARNPG